MEIRMSKPHEKTTIRKLWDYCFDDSPEFVEWFFKTRYELSNTLVLCEMNRICSALQLLPYNIVLRGKEMETSYLVGVSTWPEDRGKGHISKLLYKSLEVMRDRGQWISILLPFDYEFYRKYGWEICYSFNQYSGDRDSFIKHLSNVPLKGRIRPICLPKDIGELSACYSSYTMHLNGYVKRDTQDWDRILTDIRIDGGNGYIYQRDNKIIGFVLLVDTRDKLFIRMICSRDRDGYGEILKFAVNHADGNKQVLWTTYLDHSPIPHLIQSGIHIQEKPFVMGRIVDTQKAFENMFITCDIDMVMQIIDPLLKWNDQRYIFKAKGHGLCVLPTHKMPDVTIPIWTLSQLLWGYLTPQQAISNGMMEVYDKDKARFLDNLFPHTIPYIYEDY